jgi:hypothetical protein
MGDRHNQRNMSHPFAADFFLGYFHTTTVANNSFVTNPFIFTTMTLIILHRAEDSFAEQTIALRFISPVIYRFRFQNFTILVAGEWRVWDRDALAWQ